MHAKKHLVSILIRFGEKISEIGCIIRTVTRDKKLYFSNNMIICFNSISPASVKESKASHDSIRRLTRHAPYSLIAFLGQIVIICL